MDGRGELGGYANYADWRVANAIVVDVIRTISERDDGIGGQLDTAMVMVAAENIPAGREVRWDYDSVPRRPFRRAMLARGVPAEALDSPDYAAVVWKIRGGAAMLRRRRRLYCRMQTSRMPHSTSLAYV